MCDISCPEHCGPAIVCAVAALTLPSRGPIVRLSDHLASSLFWLCALAALVAQGALLRSAVGTAVRGAPHGAPTEPAVRVSSSRAMELAWMVLPALVLVATFWWAWHSTRGAGLTIAAERVA